MRSERAARIIPSRHSASVSGFALLDVNGSINCVSASRPVLAVTAGGKLWVSSGSTSARRGSIVGLRRLALMPCSGEASTALRVTSAPVPAVVGMAMQGNDGCVSDWPRPTTSR